MLLSEHVFAQWQEILRVLTLERGEGWQEELPSDVLVGIVGEAPRIVFRFPDACLDYLLAGDGGVHEYRWQGETGDDVVVTSWAANGERLRRVETSVAEALSALGSD